MIEKVEKEKIEKPPDKKDVWKMFDRIAGRYDLLNRMLSFGQDKLWRKKLSKLLPDKENLSVLDLASGTADILITISEKNKNLSFGVGLDMAGEMLEVGQNKITKLNLDSKLTLIRSDAMNIPLVDNSFDAVTIAFGIRNMVDVNKSLFEMHRILKKDGKALILEFSLPQNSLIRGLYLFYFRYILPLVGSIISGDDYAYRYLNRTVETFPYGEEFCKLMEESGFKNVRQEKLTFGVAAIYSGHK